MLKRKAADPILPQNIEDKFASEIHEQTGRRDRGSAVPQIHPVLDATRGPVYHHATEGDRGTASLAHFIDRGVVVVPVLKRPRWRILLPRARMVASIRDTQ